MRSLRFRELKKLVPYCRSPFPLSISPHWLHVGAGAGPGRRPAGPGAASLTAGALCRRCGGAAAPRADAPVRGPGKAGSPASAPGVGLWLHACPDVFAPHLGVLSRSLSGTWISPVSFRGVVLGLFKESALGVGEHSKEKGRSQGEGTLRIKNCPGGWNQRQREAGKGQILGTLGPWLPSGGKAGNGLGSEVALRPTARTRDACNWKREDHLFLFSGPSVAGPPGNPGHALSAHQGTVCLKKRIPLIFGCILLHLTDSNYTLSSCSSLSQFFLVSSPLY